RTGPGSGFLNQFTDPLSTTEWWPSHVGADTWTSPGPGFPLTMIDSGVDFSHEEFATRPNTTALDAQTFTANEEELHGTATASFAHFLSIGATDELDHVTDFSSASPAMDLAAPGQDMTAAVPPYWTATGYATLDGTSFSAPLVSGAAAAIWTERPKLTNTQLFEVIRRSARDVGKRGWDRNTGYGI